MKNLFILNEYCKKMDGYLREISQHTQRAGGIQAELSSTLEIMQSSIGGKIFLLFMESCLQFFSRLLYILLSKESMDGIDPFDSDRIFKIRQYIQLNYTEKINEKKAAACICMSTAHFSRYFKKMFRCSFVEYLTQSRINEVVNLLLTTEFQIIEICDRCGFNSPSQFNRAFKKLMKISPSEYREMQRKK